jgi:hypothetical protein
MPAPAPGSPGSAGAEGSPPPDDPYAPPDGPTWPVRTPGPDPVGQPPAPALPPYGTRPGAPPSWPPLNPHAPPPGTAQQGPPPPPAPELREQNLGAVALVLGLLAALLGIAVLPWLLLGPPALILGTRVRASAKAGNRTAGLATAGVVLALVGLVAAACGYLYYRGPHERQQECLRASTTFAQDKACKDAFMDDLLNR